MLVYHRGGYGNTACHLFAHLLFSISQVGLEPASASMEALLVSQCNVSWRSFVQVGGLGVKVLLFLGVFFFFLPNVAPSSQQDF
jgi:hypothetical protein